MNEIEVNSDPLMNTSNHCNQETDSVNLSLLLIGISSFYDFKTQRVGNILIYTDW